MREATRLVTVAWLLASCNPGSGEASIEHRKALYVPLPKAPGTCWDVGKASACYEDLGAKAQPHVVERTAPAFRARTKMGWRCAGSGDARMCRDRADGSANFTCRGDRCVQAHARVPDAHEWTCADAGGASLCLSKNHAAGVSATRIEPGFLCGPRRVRGVPSQERVCVDLSPDFPDGTPGSWNCHFEHDTGVTRVCKRQPRPAIGDACQPARPLCPRGALCVGGRCLPPRLAPSCWLDDDCESKKCRFGTCIAG